MKLRTLFASLLIACPSFAQVSWPWHFPDATNRMAFGISSTVAQHGPVVALPLFPADGRIAFIDASDPAKPLPYFAATNGCVIRIPGTLEAGKTRYVLAYLGAASVSEKMGQSPAPQCDYAQAVLGHAWDFDDGTQCGILTWGDRASHFGAITVKDGWLQVPVKGPDPYFIFGDMFGSADSPRNLHIDSAVYRYLELRVRQSCPQAQWEFFVTDRNGTNKSFSFDVRGESPQVFRFDLRALFPDFWDGREFRSLRIDTTNNRSGVLAEVDYVRLMPVDPCVTTGPAFSREAVAARGAAELKRVSLPRTVTAGERVDAAVKINGQGPLAWSFVSTEHPEPITLASDSAALRLPACLRAGTCTWTLGLSDDLGRPTQAVSGKLTVKPGPLSSFRVTPTKEYLDLAAPSVSLSVQGLDAFSNAVPIDLRHPLWSASPTAKIPDGRLKGNPAQIKVAFAGTAPATYRIALDDGASHGGGTAVTTVAYRKNSVSVNANGYLMAKDGSLVFPLGGLYANWPHTVDANGGIGTALDLFPCGPQPYTQGFPWSPEAEAKVGAYLQHCAKSNVTCLRLMLRNMDLVGHVDPVQLQATLHLFDLARPYGIRFNVALMEDYDKPPYVSRDILEKIVLPHYSADQLAGLPPHRARFLVKKEILASPALRYADRDAIACQKDYLRELIPVLAAREEVLCYEFENEMVFPPMAWCREISAFIRTIDPHTLVLGNPGPHDWPEPLRWRESGCDLFSYHPYNDGEPPADHGAVVFLRSKFAAQSGLPRYTGEGGINQNRWQPDTKKVPVDAAARGTRDQIWMSICCGANGCLYWTFMHESEAKEFACVSPALQALGIDFLKMKRQRPNVALVLPPARRDPRDTAMAMRLLDLGVDFDTVSTNEAAAYAVRIDLDRQTPQAVDLPATVAAPAKGWQIATLVSENDGQALLYLRNIAGGVKDFGAAPHPCQLRDVQPAEAAFTLRKPWNQVVVFDLDTREARAVTPDAAGRVTLGVSSKDFLVGLRRP